MYKAPEDPGTTASKDIKSIAMLALWMLWDLM